MRRLTLDNARINILSSNRTLVQEFPFLSRRIEIKCCGGRIQTKPDYEAIRSAIASLPEETRQKFKAALNCSTVSVFLKNQGRAQEVTF